MGGPLSGLLSRELLTTATQPLKPRAPIGQLRRQLITARLTEPLVLRGINFGGLSKDRLDLFADRRISARM